MAGGRPNSLLRHIRWMAGLPADGGGADGHLLERFVTQRDEAAFEALLSRHGPMVLGVCRRLLRDPQDAEDAFQATFLVLCCKAGSIGKREAVASWLHKVAWRIALRVRADAARRPVPDGLSLDVPAPETSPEWI